LFAERNGALLIVFHFNLNQAGGGIDFGALAETVRKDLEPGTGGR
jgi:hypothetical protein